MKIKNLFIMSLLFSLINVSLNALTIKEKIQQDLSKIGVKQEIIDETIKYKKENKEFIDLKEDGKKDISSIGEWKFVYQKNNKNYVALEELIKAYYWTGTENNPEKNKYISEYLKMEIPEDRKNFFLGNCQFFNIDDKKQKNEYFEKVKKSSDNQYYLRMIEFHDYLVDEQEEMGKNPNITNKTDKKALKEKAKKLSEKINKLDEILDNSALREKYRITDEEAYSDQLNSFLLTSTLKVGLGETEELLDDFIKKIANRKISKETAEYNAEKEVIVLLLTTMAITFATTDETKSRTIEKKLKILENSELGKRMKENEKINKQ